MEEERAEAPAELLREGDTPPADGQPLGVGSPDDPTAEPMDPPTEEAMMEPPTPMPKTVRIRKPRSMASQQVVVPEIDDRFWASLLQTQRSAAHATRLQRLSEFSLL